MKQQVRLIALTRILPNGQRTSPGRQRTSDAIEPGAEFLATAAEAYELCESRMARLADTSTLLQVLKARRHTTPSYRAEIVRR